METLFIQHSIFELWDHFWKIFCVLIIVFKTNCNCIFSLLFLSLPFSSWINWYWNLDPCLFNIMKKYIQGMFKWNSAFVKFYWLVINAYSRIYIWMGVSNVPTISHQGYCQYYSFHIKIEKIQSSPHTNTNFNSPLL